MALAAPAIADRPRGCHVTADGDLAMYFFHNAARQGDYARITLRRGGQTHDMLAACPTDTHCTAPCAGGAFEILAVDGRHAIEIALDRLVMDCAGTVDLAAPDRLVTRYVLWGTTPPDRARLCGGPA